MCKPGWRALGLLLVFLFSFAAAQQMPPEALEKYIEKKLRRNHHALRLNEKIIGDQGAALLARSPLMKSVKVLKIYKGEFFIGFMVSETVKKYVKPI